MTKEKLLTLIVLMHAPAIALAQENPDPMRGLLINLPPILALFALFYFVLIRPQRKQAKLHTEFINNLSRGDEVVTASGIIGTIQGLNERIVTLEVAPDTEIKILRSQIQANLKASIETTSTTAPARR